MMKPKDKRTVHYSFKASEAESDRIQEKMKAAGFSNQSAYTRAMALNGYVLKLDLPELHQAVRLLGRAGYDPEFGARPVKRAIQNMVLNQLSKDIIAGKVNRSNPIIIDANGDQLAFKN